MTPPPPVSLFKARGITKVYRTGSGIEVRALDVKTGLMVLDAVERINRELGTLAVIITHNEIISGMTDRVIHLSDGRISQIRKNKEHRPVGDLVW